MLLNVQNVYDFMVLCKVAPRERMKPWVFVFAGASWVISPFLGSGRFIRMNVAEVGADEPGIKGDTSYES